MFWLEISDSIAEKLSDLPIMARRGRLERAIHRALDAEGWPAGDRGEMPIGASYWYVNIHEDGDLVGHVGPIPDEDRAQRVAGSWRKTGVLALVARVAQGRALTQPGLS